MGETLIYLIFLWCPDSSLPQMSQHIYFASSPLCFCQFASCHTTQQYLFIYQSGLTDYQKQTKPQHSFLCLSYKLHPPYGTTSSVIFLVLFFYSLSSFLLVSLCSRTVLSLSAVLQRKSQHHAAKACVRSHLLNHLHRCLRGRPRKLTVGTLHQFDFLSLAGCQIVISSSLSRRDVLAATLLKGCIIGWTKRESQFSLDLKILRKNIF